MAGADAPAADSEDQRVDRARVALIRPRLAATRHLASAAVEELGTEEA